MWPDNIRLSVLVVIPALLHRCFLASGPPFSVIQICKPVEFVLIKCFIRTIYAEIGIKSSFAKYGIIAMYNLHCCFVTMEYIRQILLQNLKDLRGNLTATQVANGSGISQSAYSRYETNGWIADPDAIEKLARFYNVPSSRLFFDPNMEKPVLDPLKNTPSPKEITRKLEELIDFINK